jgi:hypothetical protein
MVQDASELPLITEYQGSPRLPKHQVIMFGRFKGTRLNPQFAAHPQMYAKPGFSFTSKAEQQLFPVRFGRDQGLAYNPFGQRRGMCSAKDAQARTPDNHGEDLLIQSDSPDSTALLDFCKLRHGRTMSRFSGFETLLAVSGK